MFIFKKGFVFRGDLMKFFEKNVGKTDKIIRILLGIAALVEATMISAPLSYVLGLIGLALIVTALLGTCTLYTILGINTNKKVVEAKKSKKK
jgi:hypothetical protein